MQSSSPASSTPTADASVIQWRGQLCNGVGTTAGVKGWAVLTVTPDALELKSSLGDYRLPRAAVVRLHRGQFYPWFFRGFRIRHNVPGLPEILQFGPIKVRSRDVLAKLKSLGYPVS